ncbi:hydroxyethylthiazole kinase [Alteribacillus bidgolensis]|uniref:Hydroxyethylthiazole kinase n=1 Tax=Alteribacillus bidgolensis TaxID=930129 RepID=A0A1G8INA9_9BACI|nr:hydroxyethylthiazole kinase [Alteribacillus bidgolensis]SDI20363.1 hydroxyethylthiazole kinase [Alteribacillus bidgolensis]
MRSKEASKLLEQVREQKPLIHNITNVVVTNFTANGILSMGAAPVMANAVQEAADMASAADALVLNIGTLNDAQIEAMMLAGKAANEKGIPIVLDPVGAGATAYRTETARKLLEQLDITLLRGNAAEVSEIAGLESDIRGVDASGGEKNMEAIASHAAKTLNIAVAVTGAKDAVADNKCLYSINNGHSMLTRITGTGCLASAVIAAFLTVTEKTASGAAAALGYYGIAAERAEGFASMQGPGTFQIELLNALYHVGEMDFKQQLNIEKEILDRGGSTHE